MATCLKSDMAVICRSPWALPSLPFENNYEIVSKWMDLRAKLCRLRFSAPLPSTCEGSDATSVPTDVPQGGEVSFHRRLVLQPCFLGTVLVGVRGGRGPTPSCAARCVLLSPWGCQKLRLFLALFSASCCARWRWVPHANRRGVASTLCWSSCYFVVVCFLRNDHLTTRMFRIICGTPPSYMKNSLIPCRDLNA